MNAVVIVPTYMRRKLDLKMTLRCLETIRQTAPGIEIMVIDDASPDRKLAERLSDYCRDANLTITLKGRNSGFSKTVNIGLKYAAESQKDAILCNADIEFFEMGWAEALLAREEEVAGGMLIFPGGGVQHAGIYYSVLMRRFDHIFRLAPLTLNLAQYERICPVTGALQRIKWQTLISIGLYDEGFEMGHEDIDYCLRVFVAGGKCVYEPNARAIHYESVFRGDILKAATKRSEDYFYAKHANLDIAQYVPTLIEGYM